jgi:ferredoxin
MPTGPEESNDLTRARSRETEAKMRIVIDLNRCQGYAQCIPLAPNVLKLHGEEAVMYDPNPDDSQRKQVLRAAASCPVQAIMLDMHDRAKGTTS